MWSLSFILAWCSRVLGQHFLLACSGNISAAFWAPTMSFPQKWKLLLSHPSQVQIWLEFIDFHLKFWIMGPNREFFLLFITSALVSLDLQRPVLIFQPYNCLSQFWICSHNISDNLPLQLQSRHSEKKGSLFCSLPPFFRRCSCPQGWCSGN